MRFLLLLCLIIILFSSISCDNNEKKINGDILVTIQPVDHYSEIYRMTEEGELTKLGPFDDAPSSAARWSPDGRKIAFATGKRSTTLGSSLYIMDADGSNPRSIKELDFGGGVKVPLFGYDPAWSPDGKKIVFDQCACEAGGNSEIVVVDLETKNVTYLTNDDFSDSYPLWFPDGSKILYSSSYRDSSSDQELYSMNPDGSNQTQVTFNRGKAAAWSSNDSIIAYYSLNDSSVHILNVISMTEIKNIFLDLSGDILTSTMTWSPDNNSVLFITIAKSYPLQHLYRLNLNDETITPLLESYDNIYDVDWLKR